MLNFLKRLLIFRMSQKSARGAARMLGFGKLSLLIGIIGGWRALRRHHHHRHA